MNEFEAEISTFQSTVVGEIDRALETLNPPPFVNVGEM